MSTHRGIVLQGHDLVLRGNTVQGSDSLAMDAHSPSRILAEDNIVANGRGDWVGWAPLPPDVTWRIGVGFSYTSIAIDRRVAGYSWCFVPARRFTDTRLRTHVLPASRNVTLLSSTRNVTRAFGARYLWALQDHPDVVMAHRDVTVALEM